MFEQAAHIRADDRVDRGAEARNITGYLLRGLIRCKVCNSIMTTATSASHGRTYRYYSCTKATKRGKSACSVRSVPGPEIKNFLVDQLAKRGWQSSLAVPVANAVAEKRRAQATALASEQRKLLSDLDRTRTEGNGFLNAFASQEGGDRRIVTDRLGELEARTAQMENRLAEIAAAWGSNERLMVGPEQVGSVLASFAGVWAALTVKERARLLHLLFAGIEYDGEQGLLEMLFTEAAKIALASEPAPELTEGAA